LRLIYGHQGQLGNRTHCRNIAGVVVAVLVLMNPMAMGVQVVEANLSPGIVLFDSENTMEYSDRKSLDSNSIVGAVQAPDWVDIWDIQSLNS
tara:strand:- start:1238 stop:1513 length:276 start_codon:yes stop_codon:yes gene_type:complete